MLERINWVVVFISFCMGLIYVVLVEPPAEVVTMRPTPDNVSDVLYEDQQGSCYVYEASNVECPKDRSQISSTHGGT
jgi:hypothetical protein